MREWLMENGDRTSVMGDFAYDTDNDAWCELGSSEGSTPVWWRKYGDGGAGAPSRGRRRRRRQLTQEEIRQKLALEKKRREEQAILKSYRKKLKECSSEEYVKKVKNSSTEMATIAAFPWSFITLVFLGAIFGVPDNGLVVAIVAVGVLVAVFGLSFALLSISGGNAAEKEIEEAKRKVADQERVVAEINKELNAYY